MMIIIVINAFYEINYSNIIKFNLNPDVQQLSFRLQHGLSVSFVIPQHRRWLTRSVFSTQPNSTVD